MRWAQGFGRAQLSPWVRPIAAQAVSAAPWATARNGDWREGARPLRHGSAREVADQLRSLCGDRIQVVGTVPFDRRVVAAEWDAKLPAKGPFTRAMQPVVQALVSAHQTSRARVHS